MHQPPRLGIRVADKDSGRFALQRVQRVIHIAHDLGEKIALGQGNKRDPWVIDLHRLAPQRRRLENRPILLEHALIVAQMVGEDREVVADPGRAFGAGHFADGVAVDGEADGFGGVFQRVEGVDLCAAVLEGDG